jgi:hypothetical protein
MGKKIIWTHEKIIRSFKAASRDGYAPRYTSLSNSMLTSMHKYGYTIATLSEMFGLKIRGANLSNNVSNRDYTRAKKVMEKIEREEMMKANRKRERIDNKRAAIEAACAGCTHKVYLSIDSNGLGYCPRACPDDKGVKRGIRTEVMAS